MQINKIENNTCFNAKLNIIADSGLLLKKDVVKFATSFL